MLFKIWRRIWTVEQADSYHKRSGQRDYMPSRVPSRLFYSLMACRKYEILYTDVLDRAAHGTNWSGPKYCVVTTVVCM
jgi:hypothetical protein